MAAVTVFVDRAVQGHLPGVCVIDGVGTAGRLTFHETVGDGARLGVAWLLLLAGPLGWLGLLVIAAVQSGRGEVLTVRLPYSAPAADRLHAARRLARSGWALVVAGTVLALAMAAVSWRPMYESLLLGAALAAGVAGLVAVGVGQWRVGRLTVGITLDASRRWVTLAGVHPAFASAATAATAAPTTPATA
jgi:hypothetical protein